MSEVAEREYGVADISEAEKTEFLQRIRLGFDRREAAAALGYKARPWRSLTSPQSPFYDEDFAHAYGEATRSPEYQINYNERLREELSRRAFTDSDRLLEKLAMVHLPEWQKLREKETNVNVRVVLEQYFRSLPTDKLDTLLAWMDEQQTIDAAEIAELAPVAEEAA